MGSWGAGESVGCCLSVCLNDYAAVKPSAVGVVESVDTRRITGQSQRSLGATLSARLASQ